MKVYDIVKKYLVDNNFDGLFTDNCGCLLDCLMPCDGDCSYCEAGYKMSVEEADMLGYEVNPDWDYIVCGKKPEEKEMGYKERQAEWLKMNDLREGSRVYVHRKPENYEDGWRYRWIDFPMDETVGKVASIVEIHPCSLKVEIWDDTFYMPYTALLPVGVTEFEVGRRYKYVGTKTLEYFSSLNIAPRDATLIASGAELMVETFEEDMVKFTTTTHMWHFKGNWKDFVALPEKDYYRELDHWINAHDLKVGDKVRILRSPTLDDMEGWACDWKDWFDKYIGEALPVVGFDDADNDIEVRIEKGTFLYVPYTVLEKVEYDISLELSKALDSVGILAMSTKVEGNRITIEGLIR